MSRILYISLFFLFVAATCKQEEISPQADILSPELGIEAVPAHLGKAYVRNFDRYTKVLTPDGGAIHIVAQNRISNEQIIRCRSILEHFLRDYPGSKYGSNKAAIANQMAKNEATLVLLNGRDDGSNKVRVKGQSLFEEEIQVEGNSWYVDQSYENHRDAAYEEILHLVHDYGIGVDGPNSSPGAAADFQTEIRAAQVEALSKEIWGKGAPDWIEELSKENSLSQEYLASLIDSYYGLWGAWTGSEDRGMWGIYAAKRREDIGKVDPLGEALMDKKFFHPYLTYNARIDATFSGTFSMKYDPNVPYSHHARYLKDIHLLGENPIDVRVNEWDNDITGNAGTNTVIFSGKYEEYEISSEGEDTRVKDLQSERDGNNLLRKVEKLQFQNKSISL